MTQADRLGCSLTALPDRLPAWEKPYWKAWQRIQPSGWDAANLNTARIGRWLAMFIGRDAKAALEDFLVPDATPGTFDPALQEEEEMERNIRMAEMTLRDDCGDW